MTCEVLHHLRNISNPKEIKRWEKRWTTRTNTQKMNVNRLLKDLAAQEGVRNPEEVPLLDKKPKGRPTGKLVASPRK